MKPLKHIITVFYLVSLLPLIASNTYFGMSINHLDCKHEHTHESHDESGINSINLSESSVYTQESALQSSQALFDYTQYHLSEIKVSQIYNSDAIETITTIEDELQAKGTSIIAELYRQYEYYLAELINASSDTLGNISSKLAQINEVIMMYESELYTSLDANGLSNDEIKSTNQISIIGISPNCTCEWWNYLLGIPCVNCDQYHNTLMAVSAIAAGFTARGWSLAADLVWQSMSNATLDSYYTPSATLVNRVAQSPQVLDEVAHRNFLTEAYNQKTPGRLNGLFANTLDGDVYNSLGKFYYSKSYSGNGNVNISILDRYDYERGGDSPGGIFISVMVTAQDIGLIIPFYTKIDITVPGTSTLLWEYTSTGVSITGAPNGINQIAIPGLLYDLRLRSQPLPTVSVTRIESNAFSNHTQLTQITIPSSVTYIGNNAFQNTNYARVYLNGRSVVPSTFDLNWNASENPVYLNGILCNHLSKTTIEINATHHGDLCNICRTIINKASHNIYTSGGWEYCYECPYAKQVSPHVHNYSGPYTNIGNLHRQYCSCGMYRDKPHVGDSSQAGDRYVLCLDCNEWIDTNYYLILFPFKAPIILDEEACLNCHEDHGNEIELSYNSAYFYFDSSESYYPNYLNRKDEYYYKRQLL